MSLPPTVRPPPVFVNDVHAPDVFATSACGLHIADGIITVTYENTRPDHSSDNAASTKVVVGRVIMPVKATQTLALLLLAFLRDRGFDPVAAATKGQTAQ